jgi:hypothetical protein
MSEESNGKTVDARPEMVHYAVFDQYGSHHGTVRCCDEGEAISTVMDHGEGDQRGLTFYATELPNVQEQPAGGQRRAAWLMFRAAGAVSEAMRLSDLAIRHLAVVEDQRSVAGFYGAVDASGVHLEGSMQIMLRQACSLVHKAGNDGV